MACAAAAAIATAGVAPAAYAQSTAKDPRNATGTPAPVTPDETAAKTAQSLASAADLTPAQQKAVDQASLQASRTGKAVPISALTTETWQVSAKPGGGLELSENTEPVRTLQHGSWVPVDTSLHRNSDGTYSPGATAYASVRLSGGGAGALATTTTAGGASYQISWPTTLPAPKVSGDTATYAGVLPGVDLAVTPNVSGGFSEVLVVHDAKAAANPALAKLTLAVHTAGTHPARGALAAAAGGMTLTATGASMWDSNTAPAAAASKTAAKVAAGASGAKAPSPAQVAASDPSSAGHAGYAAHQAPVALSASGSSLTLLPSKSLLTSKTAVFPEYIDPTLTWHVASGGTPAYDETKQDSPCNGQPYYNDTAIDKNQLGVGWTNTYCGGYQRTFYQWNLPSVLHGAYVHLATVNATEDWQASFSCSESRAVYLHWSGGIGSGTDWNTQPGYLTGANSFTAKTTVGAAFNGSGCQSPATSAAGFTVTTPLQWSATHNAGQITFGMDQESDTNYADFDRFTDNPTLNIQFDHAPNTPGAGQLSAAVGGSDKAACATATPYPYIGKAIATNNVTLTAANITSPDADELQATFKYWIQGSSTTYTATSADNLANNSNATITLPTTFTKALTNGQNVSWQVQTTNGTYPSGWSPTCTYTAEPTGPDAPTIAANTTYPDNSTGAPAGTSATFSVTGNSDGATATKFYYSTDQRPFQTVTATSGSATFTVTPATAGPHILDVEAVDGAGDVSGDNFYTVIAAAHAPTSCANLSVCFNNTAISADATPSQANADGNGYSLSATTLANAGWTSGGHVAIDGANLALPTFGTGKADNVLAANQTIACTSAMGSCTTSSTGASSLMFLTTATYGILAETGGAAEGSTAPYIPENSLVAGTYSYNGALNNAAAAPTGTITYSDGTTSSYDLAVPDWETGPGSLAVVSLPYFNNPAGKKSVAAHLYAFSVPLAPGKTISSVTLPDLASAPGTKSPAEHIFSIGTRNTTSGTVVANGGTTATPTGDTWTGAFASDTEGNYNFESANFSNQSFRVLLQPTVTGNTVRVKLDNALGTSPLDIGHATVALTTGNAITPTAAVSSPVNLTFSGSAGTVIPEGGMVYSDPLAYNVKAGQWLAVSFDITNSIPYLVQHSWATDSYEYVTPIGSGDHTADTGSTTYTASGSVNGTFTDVVTGLDVQTAGVPTQIVLGDNLIDAWQPNTAPLSPNDGNALRLSDDIAAASATTPTAYGTINAGIESNQLVSDNGEILNGTSTGEAVGGQAALTRIDRDLLDEPGLNTVILDEGLEDALAGTNASTIENGYTSLLGYLNSTGINTSGGTETFPGIVDIGLTPCDTYAGDGAATGNDPCTSTVDAIRTEINTWLDDAPNGLGSWSPTPYYYIDPDATLGVPDSSNGEVKLGPLAMVGTSRNNTPSDPVNLTNAGTGALANAVLAATDTWQLADGTGSTAAGDYADNANAYLAQSDSAAGGNPLTLNGTYTWPTATVGSQTGATVLGLDGSTGYGTTGNALVNTAGSYSISAWVDPAAATSGAQVIAGECGQNHCALYFGITTGGYWQIGGQNSDTAADSTYYGATDTAATAASNTWSHVVATFNAATGTYALYVNGSLTATATRPSTWAATGQFTVGNLYVLGNGTPVTKNFFNGQLSDVQLYDYALSAPQITALHDQIG